MGYAYGWNERLNIYGNLHPTAMLYRTFAAELGAGYEIFKQLGPIPELYLDARLAFASDAESFAAFPIISPIVSYDISWWNPYGGMDFLFQFHDNDRVWTPQSMTFFVGSAFQVSDKLETGLELKWSGFNHSFERASVDHPKAFGSDQGVLAPYLFVSYQFGGGKE
ncbi:MAG: hypothetical protein COV44_06620 [Deltaproteobacteria bacterium CG11_big_fil_rev_8_21_14_0_20_45_16]|nr:MAG: hypothetical protein COV44_06620 [Deltaproteobacteria bacterium CG11_big_fil_rev_8_21_14_0_20_45_16]